MKSVYTTSKQLDDETHAEVAAKVDRAYALADLMLMAIAADGEWTEQELHVLRESLDMNELGMDFDQLLGRLRWKEKQLRNNDQLRRSIAAQAGRLDEHHRELAYCLLLKLHHSGSRLDRFSGYRTGNNNRHNDGLLELFGKELGISHDRREQLAATPLEVDMPKPQAPSS